jgi:hypothetical protein
MKKEPSDFVSTERRKFKFEIGKVLASSLSGFIAGIIVSIIIFLTFFNLTLK